MACRVSQGPVHIAVEQEGISSAGVCVCGGLSCSVVTPHFPKASPILQAGCIHYHILPGSKKKKTDEVTKKLLGSREFVGIFANLFTVFSALVMTVLYS